MTLHRRDVSLAQDGNLEISWTILGLNNVRKFCLRDGAVWSWQLLGGFFFSSFHGSGRMHSDRWQLSVSVICFCSLCPSSSWHRVKCFLPHIQHKAALHQQGGGWFNLKRLDDERSNFLSCYGTRRDGFSGFRAMFFFCFFFPHYSCLEREEKSGGNKGSRGDI